MTISSISYDHAYVWTWLPNCSEPVVAGKLTLINGNLIFNYGQSYLARKEAISLYDKELPLQSGEIPLMQGLNMPNCLRDASPDAWGRRVIINKALGLKGKNANETQLDELTFFLESGSDRIGALDFQLSAKNYEPRISTNASLEELIESAERVEKGIPLSKNLDIAIFHGSSIGGARPKSLIDDKDKKFIAKFSSSTDLYNIVKAEFIAMRLAKLCGINVANVNLVKAAHKDVLLIERFDRTLSDQNYYRHIILSALTLLNLDEMMARYASYQDLAEIIRHRFIEPKASLRELFSRLIFNIICGNTDDHARNHAAFWDGKNLSLTPAYDICPQGRSGNEATQAMLILDNQRMSKILLCIEAAHHFLISKEEAQEIADNQVSIVKRNWSEICNEAELNNIERKLLWHRQFLNPFIFE